MARRYYAEFWKDGCGSPQYHSFPTKAMRDECVENERRDNNGDFGYFMPVKFTDPDLLAAIRSHDETVGNPKRSSVYLTIHTLAGIKW